MLTAPFSSLFHFWLSLKKIHTMKKFPLIYGVLLFVLLFSCKKNDDNVANNNNNEPDNNATTTEVTLLSTAGGQILDENGNAIQLNGIGFNNWHWIEDPLPPINHNSEIDFTRVKDMNMNAVRFALNYWVFEDDSNPYVYKQTAWDWLDENVEWAKTNGVYLILNMHTPQGGYQSQGTGDSLWDDIENQNRLSALWVAIAERYKDEPQIAGYGVVNEPVPNTSINQWSTLAQRLINDIRAVDDHIIFIEQAIEVKGQPISADLNFPDVTGTDIVYEFHTYEPFQFTHQLMDFSGVGEGGTYPDEELLELGDAAWQTAIFNNPILSANSDWQYFEGERYTLTDTDADIAVPILLTGNIGANGRVNFDDIVIDEYDADGNFVRSVQTEKLNTATGWDFYSGNDDGDGGIDDTDGRTDNSSFYIDGVTAESNLNNRLAAFEPVQGYSYEVSGWMKADNMAAGGDALIRLDFYAVDGQVHKRNRAYLESILDRVATWADARNVPIYVGEIGTGAPSFANDKGGLVFVEDMVSLMVEKNINFTYFDYHSDNFGVYLGGLDALPDSNNVRQEMIDLLTGLLE